MRIRIIYALVLSLWGLKLWGDEFPSFDFTTVEGTQGWQAAHDISKLQSTPAGLVVHIGGADPYLIGPVRDYPAGIISWLHLRLKSEQTGTCQVFYFRSNATEPESVRFNVPGGDWYEAQVPMPALAAGYHLRIDPPGSGGTCVLARLWFEERIRFQPPVWPQPNSVAEQEDAIAIQSGPLKLFHNRDMLGSFVVQVAGHNMGIGHTKPLIGYVRNRQVRWFALNNGPTNLVTVTSRGQNIAVVANVPDPDGAQWMIEQVFAPVPEGAIQVETRVTVDQDRSILYLPMLTLLPGVNSFGTNKTQGLFAGLEYLENEPSSSEADVRGPESQRQVPSTYKITFPLMAIQAEGHYVSLLWEPQPHFCAMFDSPDRLFNSGGHVMGILFPGANGNNREEGSLLPYQAELLKAHKSLVLQATLSGDTGTTIIPAVQKYVKLRGMPPVPNPGITAAPYFELAAHGWLDSKIRAGDLYRHAAWPGFGAQPAADAALWMDWLAVHIHDSALADRLTNAAAAAIGRVAPANYNAAQIGHERYPLPALIYGAVAQNADQALMHGRALLRRFQADGSVRYQPPSNGVDYSKTHWSHEANGFTAAVVASLIEAAVFSGDHELIQSALHHLRAMNKFADTVPRGAQTWEIPLHTPDILASGYLVRAYTLGYELTGDTSLLEHARYWAWTGVFFVYLTPPTPHPVGLYNTIPVLGATGWTAPVWIGLPVQWCGLVYGEALQRFAQYDLSGPWQRLADGIAAGGLQHTWPTTDPEHQGLLPDSYQLGAQLRNGPAINPATVQVPALQYYRQPPAYSFRAFRSMDLIVHAPGDIREVVEGSDNLKFTVVGWSPHPCWILINGIKKQPRVRMDGKDLLLSAPQQYQSPEGRLILMFHRQAVIELSGWR